MKKIIVALSIVAVAALGAIATPQQPPKVDKKTTIHCAVNTNNVVRISEAMKAKHYVDYHGRRYFFCCGNCPVAFKKNPKKYAKNDSILIPKPHVASHTRAHAAPSL